MSFSYPPPLDTPAEEKIKIGNLAGSKIGNSNLPLFIIEIGVKVIGGLLAYLSLSHTFSPSNAFVIVLSLSLSLSHTHTHTHTFTPSNALVLVLSLSHTHTNTAKTILLSHLLYLTFNAYSPHLVLCHPFLHSLSIFLYLSHTPLHTFSLSLPFFSLSLSWTLSKFSHSGSFSYNLFTLNLWVYPLSLSTTFPHTLYSFSPSLSFSIYKPVYLYLALWVNFTHTQTPFKHTHTVLLFSLPLSLSLKERVLALKLYCPRVTLCVSVYIGSANVISESRR